MKNLIGKFLIILLVALLNNSLHATSTGELMHVGNFVLPIALEPSPLFSFGQNILDYDDKLVYVNPLYLKGKTQKSYFNVESYFLYGLSDNASIFALLTAPLLNKESGMETVGFGDVLIQYEYAFINLARVVDEIQSTIVASIYLPSGQVDLAKKGTDISDHPPFGGFGAVSFFLGWTYSYTTLDWYSFVSIGGILTTRRQDKTKLGNEVLYQAGIGRNLKRYDDKIVMLMFEFDGIYTKRDQLRGITDPNSGGNIFYWGPVLYYADWWSIFQVGIQIPICQRLNGIQIKNSYYFSISYAWFWHDYDKNP